MIPHTIAYDFTRVVEGFDDASQSSRCSQDVTLDYTGPVREQDAEQLKREEPQVKV